MRTCNTTSPAAALPSLASAIAASTSPPGRNDFAARPFAARCGAAAAPVPSELRSRVPSGAPPQRRPAPTASVAAVAIDVRVGERCCDDRFNPQLNRRAGVDSSEVEVERVFAAVAHGPAVDARRAAHGDERLGKFDGRVDGFGRGRAGVTGGQRQRDALTGPHLGRGIGGERGALRRRNRAQRERSAMAGASAKAGVSCEATSARAAIDGAVG